MPDILTGGEAREVLTGQVIDSPGQRVPSSSSRLLYQLGTQARARTSVNSFLSFSQLSPPSGLRYSSP